MSYQNMNQIFHTNMIGSPYWYQEYFKTTRGQQLSGLIVSYEAQYLEFLAYISRLNQLLDEIKELKRKLGVEESNIIPGHAAENESESELDQLKKELEQLNKRINELTASIKNLDLQIDDLLLKKDDVIEHFTAAQKDLSLSHNHAHETISEMHDVLMSDPMHLENFLNTNAFPSSPTPLPQHYQDILNQYLNDYRLDFNRQMQTTFPEQQLRFIKRGDQLFLIQKSETSDNFDVTAAQKRWNTVQQFTPTPILENISRHKKEGLQSLATRRQGIQTQIENQITDLVAKRWGVQQTLDSLIDQRNRLAPYKVPSVGHKKELRDLRQESDYTPSPYIPKPWDIPK